MSDINHNLDQIMKLFPEVERIVDPDRNSKYMNNILDRLKELLETLQVENEKIRDRLDAGNLTEDELREVKTVADSAGVQSS